MTKAMTLVTNIQMLNMCYRASCNLCKFYDTKLKCSIFTWGDDGYIRYIKKTKVMMLK